MLRDIRHLKSGEFYTTNNVAYPLAYVLKISFEDQITAKPNFPNLKDFDYVVIRYLHVSAYTKAYEGSFENISADMKLVKMIDLPLKFDDSARLTFIEYADVKHFIEMVCTAHTSSDRIFCQANPYKFKYKISIGMNSGAYSPDIILIDHNPIPELITLFSEMVGFSEFVYFKHFSPGIHKNGDTYNDGFDFYFKDLNLFNLVKLSTKRQY